MSPKEISEILTFDRSKISVDRLILKLEKDGFDFQAFFDELPRIKFPTRWYMTWMLTHYVERNKREGTAHQDLVWSVLKDCDNQSMLRDLWRTMSLIEVKEELAGEVYDASVKATLSSMNAIAVRAHAMFTAANIAMPYPELRIELAMILKGFNEDTSAGLRARARNLIKKLEVQGKT
jgi:hypothetical protein